jgi:uncharacterized glyoxalase superfamily protein PhnB
MKLDIYLNYRGNCEQAFRFYEGPAETQDDVRTSFSGRHIAKSGGAVAGPGL